MFLFVTFKNGLFACLRLYFFFFVKHLGCKVVKRTTRASRSPTLRLQITELYPVNSAKILYIKYLYNTKKDKDICDASPTPSPHRVDPRCLYGNKVRGCPTKAVPRVKVPASSDSPHKAHMLSSVCPDTPNTATPL